MSSVMMFEIVALIICLFFSAFFSGSETALTSLSDIRCRQLYESERRGARNLRLWIEYPNEIITTILIGNNVVNILSSALATGMAIELFGSVGIGIATGVMTFLVLVFGEIMPKTFAKHNAERVVIPIASVLRVAHFVLYPFVRLFTMIATAMISATGGSVHRDGPGFTEEDIEYMINAGSEVGVIHDEKSDMLSSIFEFSDTMVKEVMLPKPHVFMLSVDTPLEQMIEMIIERGHSRIPIYEETDEQIIGLLYVKDLLELLRRSDGADGFQLREHLRDPHYVPEVKKVQALFQQFKEERFHMALVVDEYGSFSGIVTLEDLIEEIVGEIRDEYDIAEIDLIESVEDGCWVVDARINIDDFKQSFEMPSYLAEGEEDAGFDSLGGLLTWLADGLPETGTRLQYGGLRFEIEDVDERRIRTVRVSYTDPDEGYIENGTMDEKAYKEAES